MSNKIDLEQGRGRTLCNDHSLKDVTILYISEWINQIRELQNA